MHRKAKPKAMRSLGNLHHWDELDAKKIAEYIQEAIGKWDEGFKMEGLKNPKKLKFLKFCKKPWILIKNLKLLLIKTKRLLNKKNMLTYRLLPKKKNTKISRLEKIKPMILEGMWAWRLSIGSEVIGDNRTKWLALIRQFFNIKMKALNVWFPPLIFSKFLLSFCNHEVVHPLSENWTSRGITKNALCAIR